MKMQYLLISLYTSREFVVS